MVKPVQAGEESLYGHKWIAERDTNLALLPVGHADGVYQRPGRADRCADQWRLRRSVGRICMDQFVVDLGPGEPDVAEGDEAILFGPGTSGELTAQDWADLPGTIHYEVVTSPRGGWCAATGRRTPVATDQDPTPNPKPAKGHRRTPGPPGLPRALKRLARKAKQSRLRPARRRD